MVSGGVSAAVALDTTSIVAKTRLDRILRA